MRLIPHDFQAETIHRVANALMSGVRRMLVASPTGTGKSVIEVGVQERLGRGAWVVTPRLEIVAGLLDKAGADVAGLSEAQLILIGKHHRVTTPIRLRNDLVNATVETPEYLVLDEGHHATAATYKDLLDLCPHARAALFTATPFRGTPAGTVELHETWGKPTWAITLRAAVSRGFLSIPRVQMLPLVDDDTVDIVNGELSITSLTRATKSRIEDLVGHMAAWYAAPAWDRVTMVSTPSVDAAMDLDAAMTRRGLPSILVTGNTGHADRGLAFQKTVDRLAVLIQVNVISEGVDLPIRRLVDAAPTLSPVKWLQQLGRITRPVGSGEDAPEYVCTNRNLERHAYLLEGAIPMHEIALAQEAWDKPSRRAGTRAFGLEALGRFKGTPIPLLSGGSAMLFAISALEGDRVTQYAVLVHPTDPEVTWAARTNQVLPPGSDGRPRRAYGRWSRVAPPTDVSGFASVPAAPLEPKQKAWWVRSAAQFGLDPSADVDRRQFVALPVLANLRLTL